jgi:hypothetical protein
MKFKEGDLAWMPSNITLTQMNKGNDVSKWMKTDEPAHVLVLDDPVGAYYLILFEGERWLARKNDLYEKGYIKKNKNVG